MNILKDNYYNKLIEWREVMSSSGLCHRAEEIQDMIDDLCSDHVECFYTYRED